MCSWLPPPKREATIGPKCAPILKPSRDEIGVGSLVLATVGVEDGWWEALVIRLDGDVLTLKWRDFPREPTVMRRRTELALLPTGAN